ncbi:MAG: hypothetical protein HY074_08015 [Deltaproteobacteria bacterium]|nr:hypothetical protein [Deltaproteobacteria bacterium]
MSRYLGTFLSMAVLVGLSLTMGGCKAQQQMQQQLAEMDTKLQQSERHIKDLTADLAKTNFELNQMKGLVKQTAQSVVDLQKAEEERARAALEAKQKADAAKTAKPMPKKPLPKKGKGKK